MNEDIKKSVETAKLILKQGHCIGVDCRDQCPSSYRNNNDGGPCGSNRFFTGDGNIADGEPHPDHLQAFRDYIAKHETKPDIDALLKAHKELVVEGAETKDVRYFFYIEDLDVIKFVNGKGEWMWISGRSFNSGLEIDYIIEHDHYIEVTERDLPYLKKPSVEKYGETEFRKVENDDSIIVCKVNNGEYVHGGIASDVSDGLLPSIRKILSGYRWCKPRAKTCECCGQEIK